MVRIRGMAVSVIALAIAACSMGDPVGLEWRQVPAILAFSNHTNDIFPDLVTAPDVVGLNADFEVVVKSAGGGCFRQGSVDVEQGATSVDVRVYDFEAVTRGNTACTDDLKPIRHQVTLRRTMPGTFTLRIHGREAPGDAPVVIEREIEVQ